MTKLAHYFLEFLIKSKTFRRYFKFTTFKEFKKEWNRLGSRWLYDALMKNESAKLKKVKIAGGLPVAFRRKITRVLDIFEFTPQQIIVNKRMLDKGLLLKLPLRAIQVYQYLQAGVHKKNIFNYLPVTTGTVYSNCSNSRTFLNLEDDKDVIALLIAENDVKPFSES